jgi:hypothetical protein
MERQFLTLVIKNSNCRSRLNTNRSRQKLGLMHLASILKANGRVLDDLPRAVRMDLYKEFPRSIRYKDFPLLFHLSRSPHLCIPFRVHFWVGGEDRGLEAESKQVFRDVVERLGESCNLSPRSRASSQARGKTTSQGRDLPSRLPFRFLNSCGSPMWFTRFASTRGSSTLLKRRLL